MSNITLSDLELPFEAAGVMHYNKPAIKQVGNHLVVGYLANDDDCENPLEMWDGTGKIHAARDTSSEEKACCRKALAFDSYNEPDLELDQIEEDVEDLFRKRVKQEFAADLAVFLVRQSAEGVPSALAMRNLLRDFREAVRPEYGLTTKLYDSGVDWDGLCKEAWVNGRKAGSIGDPDAVNLNCYQHGNTTWRVACHANTDHETTDGVWVPDDCLREMLNEHPAGSAERREMAVKYAEEAVETYNQWLNGDCYGVVVAVFENVAADEEGPEWEFVSSKEAWGFLGSEYAMEEAETMADSEIKHVRESLKTVSAIYRNFSTDIAVAAAC